MRTLQVILTILLIASLSSCGGGGGGGGGAGAGLEGSLSLFVTDNLNTNFSKVWVTITDATAIEDDATEHNIFTNAAGNTYNLITLSDVGDFLNVNGLPAGTYTSIRLTLDNDITLIGDDGTTTNANFAVGGASFNITVFGNFTITAGQNTVVGLDFDTTQFTYDPISGLATAVVIFRDSNDVSNLGQLLFEVEGFVTSVDSLSTFSMRLEHGTEILDVTLFAGGFVFSEVSGQTSSDTSLLAVGQKVEAKGQIDSDNLTVLANSVKIKNNDGGSGGDDQDEVKGFVVSIIGNTVSLNVIEADHFVPPTEFIDLDITNALFSTGSAMILQVGQEIEAKGTWTPGTSTFTTDFVEIEGASHDDDEEELDEAKGFIASVNGNTFTLTWTELEGFAPGTNPITVDFTNAWFEDGTANDIVIDAKVQVKGMWTGNQLDASRIEFEDADDDEARGTIQSVNGTTLVLLWTETDNFTPGENPITVDFTNAQIEDGTVQDLLQGVNIEVKGSWDGETFTAAIVEVNDQGVGDDDDE